MTKGDMFDCGVFLMRQFCKLNGVVAPHVVSLTPADRYYHLQTCAFYRFRAIDAKEPTIWIMVDKCASIGLYGRQWSCPGYVIDRTPYGVLQHELGHHVDHVYSDTSKATFQEGLYSYACYQHSKEPQLTGYLGTDSNQATFYKEWFAEIFRLFVTNPDLCRLLRPRFYEFVTRTLRPVLEKTWREALRGAPERTVLQAEKKIAEVKPAPGLF